MKNDLLRGGSLTKTIIPACTETTYFMWCKPNYSQMTPGWRALRGSEVFCRHCGHQFADGEPVAIAMPKKGRSWSLCAKCVDELRGEKL